MVRTPVARAAAVPAALLGVLAAQARLVRMRTPIIDGFEADEIGGVFGGEGDAELLRLVWVGDSTGVGIGATSVEATAPRLVARRLERPVELRVLATSGNRVTDALRAHLAELRRCRPAWVVIALGANDVIHLTPRARFRAGLDVLLHAARAVGAERIAVLGLNSFGYNTNLPQPLRRIVRARAAQLDADIRTACRRHDAAYVDLIGDRAAEFFADPGRYHATDGFHPGDEGYAHWADAVLSALGARPER